MIADMKEVWSIIREFFRQAKEDWRDYRNAR